MRTCRRESSSTVSSSPIARTATRRRLRRSGTSKRSRRSQRASAASAPRPATGPPSQTLAVLVVSKADTSGREETPQDIAEDPAVAEVLALARRVEPDAGAEPGSVGPHRDLVSVAVLYSLDGKLLAPSETEGRGRFAVEELQRQDPRHQEVRAVNPLVRLRDHRAHAEELRSLRGPVSRRARAILLAGDDDERRASREIALRGVV